MTARFGTTYTRDKDLRILQMEIDCEDIFNPVSNYNKILAQLKYFTLVDSFTLYIHSTLYLATKRNPTSNKLHRWCRRCDLYKLPRLLHWVYHWTGKFTYWKKLRLYTLARYSYDLYSFTIPDSKNTQSTTIHQQRLTHWTGKFTLWLVYTSKIKYTRIIFTQLYVCFTILDSRKTGPLRFINRS